MYYYLLDFEFLGGAALIITINNKNFLDTAWNGLPVVLVTLLLILQHPRNMESIILCVHTINYLLCPFRSKNRGLGGRPPLELGFSWRD